MEISRLMPSTVVGDWSRNYVKAPKIKPVLTLSSAVSGKSAWTAEDGKLYITNPSTQSNIFYANGDFNISVKMWGAGAGGSSGTSGGAGGFTQAIIPVSLGVAYICAVGGAGTYVPDSGGATAAGGVNGGGRGYRAGSGGGFSGIFKDSYAFSNAIMIAAGGGGGGHSKEGGAGGGTSGQTGVGPTPGYGASQSGGGGGSEGSGAGGQLGGGNGAGDWGGGGGGGYYGGGGSGETPGQVSGAGGGSSYFSPTLTIGGSTTGGSYTTVGNSSDSDRINYGNSATQGVIVIQII